MHLQELWPFPAEEVARQIDRARKWVVVENNYTAQLAGIIQEYTCYKPAKKITKYDGRPFLYEEVLNALKKEV